VVQIAQTPSETGSERDNDCVQRSNADRGYHASKRVQAEHVAYDVHEALVTERACDDCPPAALIDIGSVAYEVAAHKVQEPNTLTGLKTRKRAYGDIPGKEDSGIEAYKGVEDI